MTEAFTHRVLSGWISEYVTRALPGVWPQIPLDDETLADFEANFDVCCEAGYTALVIWGLWTDHAWPEDIASCVDAERRMRIQRLLDGAHARDLKVLAGLGLYSWGFDEIIRRHPYLAPGKSKCMCPAVDESHAWMDHVLDFVTTFDIDGLNMQSADEGRCTCESCRDQSTVEYHARLNRRVAARVREVRSDWLLMVDNWGCPYSDPADEPHLVTLSRDVDFIQDHNNSAARTDPTYRKRLIPALACPFGTLAGRSIWSPQRWAADRWFIPTTCMNVAYVRSLHADGGRGATQFAVNVANPGDEITLRFMGGLLADVSADADALLADAVERVYAPVDLATRRSLVDLVKRVEDAFMDCAKPDISVTKPVHIRGGLHDEESRCPRYLEAMSPDAREEYSALMRAIADDFRSMRSALRNADAVRRTERCLQNLLADAEGSLTDTSQST